MIFEKPKCLPGEIFLDTFLEREIRIYDANLQIRKAKKYNRGVNKYYDVFVQRSELENFLIQAKADLEEEKNWIEQQKRVYAVLNAFSKMNPGKEMECDEVFFGFYPDVSMAQNAFSSLVNSFESIRGGSMVQSSDSMSFYDEYGTLVENKSDTMFYYFVEQKEFLANLVMFKESIVLNCENYKCMEIFYEEMKSYLGG